jgi:hypothetical protein
LSTPSSVARSASTASIVCSELAKLPRCFCYLGLAGANQQIEAAFGADPGEMIANAGGSADDEREGRVPSAI